MKIAISTEMKLCRSNRTSGFTLIEMLVVIGIIAVVAGLVVGLAGVASSNKKLSRTKTELEKLTTLIDAYKAKVGVYPPDHLSNPGVNTLLYELAGAIRDIDNTASNPNYISPLGDVRSNVLSSSFGVNGILNAMDIFGETNQIHRGLKDLQADQKAQIVPGSLSLVVPVEGPNGQPNPWQYLAGTNAVHNPDTYDLWVEIVISRGPKGKTNIIGNWKN